MCNVIEFFFVSLAEKEPIPSVKAKDLVDSVTELLEQKKLEFIEAREPSNIDNDPIVSFTCSMFS